MEIHYGNLCHNKPCLPIKILIDFYFELRFKSVQTVHTAFVHAVKLLLYLVKQSMYGILNY